MKKTGKRYPPSFKTKVAVEALKEDRTSAELASQYEVDPTQSRHWKSMATQGLVELLSDKQQQQQEADRERLIEELYKQIGQLKVELDWLKKAGLIAERESVPYRRSLWEHSSLSASRDVRG